MVPSKITYALSLKIPVCEAVSYSTAAVSVSISHIAILILWLYNFT